jgi:hypothetical protein
VGRDGTPRVPRPIEEFTGRSAVVFRALLSSPLGGTVLLVDLGAPADARIEVFDLAGRQVRTLGRRVLPAGATLVSWDGREESGLAARRGVYFVRLTTASSRRTVRVLVTPLMPRAGSRPWCRRCLRRAVRGFNP